MLYLVIAEQRGTPPPASVATLEAGEATLARLLELQEQGAVEGAGVFSGRSGMCFRLDVPSNTALHLTLASLPAFAQAEWQVIPLLSLEEDLEITRGAIEHFEAGS
ncbi:MAG TPA: muconolactone Delta-isomerase family protein [Acidimicrobiia bacterium]|nr:muconolactone Delta-isomerase family protein [Acidimicrobiia bacterium]